MHFDSHCKDKRMLLQTVDQSNYVQAQTVKRVTEANPSYGDGYRNLGVALEAEQKLESAPLDIELIDEFREPMKIKDTIAGKILLEKRNEIMDKLRESSERNGYNISPL